MADFGTLALEGVTHRFGTVTAVQDVSLGVASGELVALLGPSGCGKTTLLRAIAGFVAQTQGTVVIGGRRVDRVPPSHRGVGIVFQNYALFPHMTAGQNVAYGLEARGERRPAVRARVEELLDVVQMRPFIDRYPSALSGGQQQRVALARALAIKPSVLLLDEPFGALDKSLRLDMQIEVRRIQRALGITTILVTHDQEEALSMADRIVVLNKGRLEQVGTPAEIYDRPASMFVNTFVGTANVIPGVLIAKRDALGEVELATGGRLEAEIRSPGLEPGSRVVVCIRPENIVVRARPSETSFPGKVLLAMTLGPTTILEVTAGEQTLKVMELRTPVSRPRHPGEDVFLELAVPGACGVFASPAVPV